MKNFDRNKKLFTTIGTSRASSTKTAPLHGSVIWLLLSTIISKIIIAPTTTIVTWNYKGFICGWPTQLFSFFNIRTHYLLTIVAACALTLTHNSLKRDFTELPNSFHYRGPLADLRHRQERKKQRVKDGSKDYVFRQLPYFVYIRCYTLAHSLLHTTKQHQNCVWFTLILIPYNF